MENKNEKFNIVYIIGSGRSGSTLISHLIGAHQDFENVGEVYNYGNFLEKQADRLCADGSKFLESPFWYKVRNHLKNQTGEEVIDLKSQDFNAFEKNNYLFFTAMRQATSKKWFVDSSKRLYRLKFLLRSKHFNVKIIHFIKDPRAYAYNANLSFENDPSRKDLKYVTKLREWVSKNMFIYLSIRNNGNYMTVRYEDFCKEPDATMNAIFKFLDSQFNENQFRFWEVPQYAFSGNLRMITRGKQKIEWDKRYLSMSKLQWLVGNLITLPCLLFFKYPVTRQGLLRKFGK